MADNTVSSIEIEPQKNNYGSTLSSCTGSNINFVIPPKNEKNLQKNPLLRKIPIKNNSDARKMSGDKVDSKTTFFIETKQKLCIKKRKRKGNTGYVEELNDFAHKENTGDKDESDDAENAMDENK